MARVSEGSGRRRDGARLVAGLGEAESYAWDFAMERQSCSGNRLGDSRLQIGKRNNDDDPWPDYR